MEINKKPDKKKTIRGGASRSVASSGADYRKQAEARALEKASLLEDAGALTPEESRLLVHELRVHQIELEMQNDELRQAHEELEASRSRYFDLYDLAPVGYITISEKGVVLKSNLTASNLLGFARTEMTGKPFASFVLRDDTDIYHLGFRQLMKTGAPQTLELRAQRKDGACFWSELGMAAASDIDGVFSCRAVLSDVTERMNAQASLAEKELRFLSRKVILGLEEERKRLSRELHDSIGQKIVSIQLEIEWLKSRDADRADKDFYDNMNKITVDAVEELQRICRGLRPLVIDKVGFNAAIKSLLQEFESNCDMLICARIEPIDDTRVNPDTGMNIYRILQEALLNIVRHSKTRKAFVNLREEGAELALEVLDEGCGLEDMESKKLSFGLLGMRERANMSGGRFEMDSEPGKGTRIKVLIPVGTPMRRQET